MVYLTAPTPGTSAVCWCVPGGSFFSSAASGTSTGPPPVQPVSRVRRNKIGNRRIVRASKKPPSGRAGLFSLLSASVEDHGLAGVHEDAVFEVPAHGAGQHHLLQVASLLHQVLELIAVRNPYHVLLDDRPLVQVFSSVVDGTPIYVGASFVLLCE